MEFILGAFLVAVLATGVVAVLLRFVPRSLRPLGLASICTVLVTPSLAPATIVVVPVPFGLLLAISVREALVTITMFPLWHTIAFPVTFLLSYLVGYKIFKECVRANTAT